MDELLYMDAVITPHRSLSPRGFVILIGVMTAINVACALLFLAMGAAPVPLFLCLDLAAVIAAFAVSNRAGRRSERVQVSAGEVRVVLESRAGARVVWRSPTAFTRVALVGDPEADTDLLLRLSDRAVPVARALSRPERAAFARALEAAIGRARAGVI